MFDRVQQQQAEIIALPASPAESSCSPTCVSGCLCMRVCVFYDPFGNSLQRDHHGAGIIKVNLRGARPPCDHGGQSPLSVLTCPPLPYLSVNEVTCTAAATCLLVFSALMDTAARLVARGAACRLVPCRPSAWKQLGSVTSAGGSLPSVFPHFHITGPLSSSSSLIHAAFSPLKPFSHTHYPHLLLIASAAFHTFPRVTRGD